MDASRWERIQAVFHRVADLPPALRLDSLREECGGDAELADEVLALLDEDLRTAQLLDRSVEELAGELLDDDDEGRAHQRIGPYEVERVIGEGGMGTVLLARRPDVGSQAAIKILRDAWISPARRLRFQGEQRTLAQLSHRNIARLLDADTLPDGTPYIVMEYVDGMPLDRYCRERRSSISERLQLFRAVCEAVRFAHQRAVIHRDLKPSNVMVDRQGEVKLLDFGIAKHLADNERGATQTRTGLRLLTPAYAAPEQIRGDETGVHTDVYSLGVMLYQLLTGRLPFDIAERTPAATVAFLADHEPVKPSTLARTVGRHSSGEVPFDGDAAWDDLDVLCLTAMHKDVRQRYSSAEALIRDIDRYLAGQPLEARPDTLGYRLRKLLRRRRGAVAATMATVAVVAGLAAYFVVRLSQERNAAVAEAARTERIQRFMLNLFHGGDTSAGPANDLRVATLLDRGTQEARLLDRDPAIQAELFRTLGTVYQSLGSLERAESLLTGAVERERSIGDVARLSQSLVALGLLRVTQARHDDAERLIREAIDVGKTSLVEHHPARVAATDALGRVLEAKGAYKEAIAAFEEAVRWRSTREASPADLADSLYGLANVHFYAGRYEESRALNERVLEMNRTLYGENHPRVAETLINLGAIQHELGRYREAEQLHRKALAIHAQFHGADHPSAASSMTMVARALVFQSRLDEADAMLRRAVDVQERVFGGVHPRVASALNELGNVALMRGRYREAREAYGRMAGIYQGVYAGNHYLVATAISNQGSAYLAEGEHRKAEKLFRDAVSIFERTLSPGHVNTAIARVKLGRALLRQKRYAAAAAESGAGYEILTKQVAPAIGWLQAARSDLRDAYTALGDAAKAKAMEDERRQAEQSK